MQEPETITKKRAFCAILDDIESWILNGEIDIHHVPDLIASRYSDYLKRLGMLHKGSIGKSVEFVMKMSKQFLSGLSVVRLSPAVQSLFTLSKESIRLSREEMNASNGELAYIEYVNNHFTEPCISQLDVCP